MEKDEPLLFPEHVAQLEADVSALGFAYFAFSHNQRRAIRRRDSGSCHFPEEGGHGGYLHVHHILPKSLESTTGIDVDHPLNAIMVCEKHHKLIHGGNGAGVVHETEKGAVIWDHTYDDELISKALENTQKAIRKGWKFPHE